jgi:hypothetical protein
MRTAGTVHRLHIFLALASLPSPLSRPSRSSEMCVRLSSNFWSLLTQDSLVTLNRRGLAPVLSSHHDAALLLLDAEEEALQRNLTAQPIAVGRRHGGVRQIAVRRH